MSSQGTGCRAPGGCDGCRACGIPGAWVQITALLLCNGYVPDLSVAQGHLPQECPYGLPRGYDSNIVTTVHGMRVCVPLATTREPRLLRGGLWELTLAAEGRHGGRDGKKENDSGRKPLTAPATRDVWVLGRANSLLSSTNLSVSQFC